MGSTKIQTPVPTDNGTDQPTVESVVADYRAADRKGQAAIRKTWNETMALAIDNGNLDAARFARTVLTSLVAAPKPSSEPTDYRALVAAKIANLRLAADLLESGSVRPDGVPDDADLTDTEEHPLPTVEADTEIATKIASAKISKSADRRDVGAYIARAFESVPVGTYLSASAIRSAGAVEGDDYRPSTGAITARLFADGGCTVEGVEPTIRDTNRGATKV